MLNLLKTGDTIACVEEHATYINRHVDEPRNILLRFSSNYEASVCVNYPCLYRVNMVSHVMKH